MAVTTESHLRLFLLMLAATLATRTTPTWTKHVVEGKLQDMDEDLELRAKSMICHNSTDDGESEAECCWGYQPLNETTKGGVPLCRPVCDPPCVNAECAAPNVCDCHEGFRKVEGVPHHKCLAVCDQPCVNSYCVKRNLCECKPGYKTTENRYVCELEEGVFDGEMFGNSSESDYFEDSTAEPGPSPAECWPPCGAFSRCVGLNECACETGYKPSSTAPDECEPVCDPPCGSNASCSAPGTCDCVNGYSAVNNGTCVPFCSPPCGIGGKCIAPNSCSCNHEYQLGPEGDCIAICDSGSFWDRSTHSCMNFSFSEEFVTVTLSKPTPPLIWKEFEESLSKKYESSREALSKKFKAALQTQQSPGNLSIPQNESQSELSEPSIQSSDSSMLTVQSTVLPILSVQSTIHPTLSVHSAVLPTLSAQSIIKPTITVKSSIVPTLPIQLTDLLTIPNRSTSIPTPPSHSKIWPTVRIQPSFETSTLPIHSTLKPPQNISPSKPQYTLQLPTKTFSTTSPLINSQSSTPQHQTSPKALLRQSFPEISSEPTSPHPLEPEQTIPSKLSRTPELSRRQQSNTTVFTRVSFLNTSIDSRRSEQDQLKPSHHSSQLPASPHQSTPPIQPTESFSQSTSTEVLITTEATPLQCSPSCVNGRCGGSGVCECVRGWTGADCASRCTLRAGRRSFDSAVCPELINCICRSPTEDGRTCFLGMEIKCMNTKVSMTNPSKKELPHWFWIVVTLSVTGASILLVVLPLAVILYLRFN